jgi:Raf kinase inhibitor-like YbhB/YbcL family protein
VPAGTVEVALVVDDPDAARGTYVHWVVVGIDPARTELAESAVPPGARQVSNSAGTAAYTGPCPPGGPPHHYRFTVYALQHKPGVAGDASPEAAIEAIEAAAGARGRLVGMFGRLLSRFAAVSAGARRRRPPPGATCRSGRAARATCKGERRPTAGIAEVLDAPIQGKSCGVASWLPGR